MSAPLDPGHLGPPEPPRRPRRVAAGSYELTYQARATIDGRFTAAPATIEAMYQPDQRARTAREAITVAASPSSP